MAEEFRLSDLKLDETRYPPLRQAQTAHKRILEYWGKYIAEVYDTNRELALHALERMMTKAAETYVLPFLKSFNIPGNDARTVASFFLIASGIIWGIQGKYEIVEDTPQRFDGIWYLDHCVVSSTDDIRKRPELCYYASAFERTACRLINPKLKWSCPRNLTRGDSLCEVIFELED